MTKSETTRRPYSEEVIADIRQLARLLEARVPLNQLAERMAVPQENLITILTVFGVEPNVFSK